MGTTERGKDRLALREVGRSRRRAATVTFFILYPIWGYESWRERQWKAPRQLLIRKADRKVSGWRWVVNLWCCKSLMKRAAEVTHGAGKGWCQRGHTSFAWQFCRPPLQLIASGASLPASKWLRAGFMYCVMFNFVELLDLHHGMEESCSGGGKCALNSFISRLLLFPPLFHSHHDKHGRYHIVRRWNDGIKRADLTSAAKRRTEHCQTNYWRQTQNKLCP